MNRREFGAAHTLAAALRKAVGSPPASGRRTGRNMPVRQDGGYARHHQAAGFQTFCVTASALFAMVIVYTLIVKIPSGELASDWLHSVLHVATAAAAWYAASTVALARIVTMCVTAVYAVLGTLGWWVSGFFLGTPVAIPLDAADNIFHLGLAAFGVALITRTRSRRLTSAT